MQRSLCLVLLIACGAPAKTPDNTGPSGDLVQRAPSQPALTATVGDKRVTLTWNSAGIGVGYQVRRGLPNDPNETLVGTTNALTFVDDTSILTNCTTYIYRIRAENPLGSADSDAIEAVPTSDVSCWQRKTASPSWSDIASVSSVSIAVGDNNYYKRSTSPSLWSNVFLPSRDAFNTVVAYNNTFYAGTAQGAVYTSTDGALFTKKVEGVPGTRIIAVSNNLVRLSGTDVYVSSDGGTVWNKIATGAPSALVDVAFGHNIVVAAFETGFVASTDYGASWSPVLTPTIEGRLTGIAYGESPGIQGFVAVTQQGSIWSSDINGLNWLFTKAYPNPIVGIAYGGAPANAWAIVFVDGHVLVWNNPGSLPGPLTQSLPATNPVRAVRFTDAQFKVVGSGDMILSSNGISNNWSQASIGGSWNAIEVGLNSVITVGSSGKIARSTDMGESWAERNVDGTYVLRSIAFGLGRWVACGELSVGSDEGGIFVSKDDGENWTRVSGINERCASVRFLNGRFFAGMRGHTIRTWSGVDGQGWATAMTQGSTSAAISDISFGTKYLAISSNSASVFTSTDGNVWTTAGNGLINYFDTGAAGLTFIGGAFLAYGKSPGLARSTDGGLWMPIAAEYNFTRVRFINGKHIAVGGSDQLYVSTNGTVWTPDTIFAGASVTDFVQVSNRLIGVGPDATYVRTPPK